MDVWMTWCKRISRCSECDVSGERSILLDTPVVVTKYRKKGNTAAYYNYYHPHCWLIKGFHYLEKHGLMDSNQTELYVEQIKSVLIPTNQDSKIRRLAMRRKATINYRLRKAINDGDLIKAEHLTNKLKEIEELFPRKSSDKPESIRCTPESKVWYSDDGILHID